MRKLFLLIILFTACHSVTAQYQWMETIGDNLYYYFNESNIVDLKTDAIGNIYLMGTDMNNDSYLKREFTFFNNSYTLHVGNEGGNATAFIAKFTPDGKLLWVKGLGEF